MLHSFKIVRNNTQYFGYIKKKLNLHFENMKY
jgi:hypothetical protein